MNGKRLGALFMLAAFLLLALFPSLYARLEAEHECSGEDCPICEELEQLALLRRDLALGLALAALMLRAVISRIGWLSERRQAPARGTLVSLKVRLND